METESNDSPADRGANAFWSTQTLKNRLHGIVREYEPENTKEACHQLTMGYEYLVTTNAQSRGEENKSVVQLGHEEAFNIPPGQFGFLQTLEVITMPDDAIGFVNIASKVKFRGLVNISGFHVDPGYSGRLIFAVFNAGPSPVVIRQGEKIFRIWIAGLDESDSDPRRKPGFDNISSEVANNISGDLESIQSISKELIDFRHELRSLKSNVLWHSGFLLALSAGLFVAFLMAGIPSIKTLLDVQLQPSQTEGTMLKDIQPGEIDPDE